MKRIVFLLCLFVLSYKGVSANITRTFHEGDTTYIVSDFYEDGSRGFILEKQGINPFVTSLIVQGESYNIKGVKELNNQIFVYGSAHIKGAATFYDSVMFIYDLEGNYIQKKVLDYQELEETDQVYFFDNLYVVLITEHIDVNGEYIFNGHHFVLYDTNFNVLNEVYLDTEVKSIKQTDKYLLLDYEYDGYFEMALNNQLEITYSDDLINLPNQSQFIDQVDIPFINQAVLNEEIVENGVFVDYPGNYHLRYNNSSYYFTVLPVINGVEDGGVYQGSVLITVSNGNVFLNDDIFVNGTVTSNPGNYILTVNGVGGYTKTVSFTITSSMDGLLNNHDYKNPFEFYFEGEGYLNEQHIESPITISENGEYTFKVIGEKDYIETYQFTLNQEQETSFIDFVQRFDIVVLVATIITGIIILKKK